MPPMLTGQDAVRACNSPCHRWSDGLCRLVYCFLCSWRSSPPKTRQPTLPFLRCNCFPAPPSIIFNHLTLFAAAGALHQATLNVRVFPHTSVLHACIPRFAIPGGIAPVFGAITFRTPPFRDACSLITLLRGHGGTDENAGTAWVGAIRALMWEFACLRPR